MHISAAYFSQYPCVYFIQESDKVVQQLNVCPCPDFLPSGLYNTALNLPALSLVDMPLMLFGLRCLHYHSRN